MISFSDITKAVQRRSRGVSDSRQMHASREWATGVLVAIVVVTLGSMYLWSLYHSYRDTTLIDDSNPNTTTIYQAEIVSQALTKVTEKQTMFQNQFGALSTDSAIAIPEVMTSESATTSELIVTEAEEPGIEPPATVATPDIMSEGSIELQP